MLPCWWGWRFYVNLVLLYVHWHMSTFVWDWCPLTCLKLIFSRSVNKLTFCKQINLLVISELPISHHLEIIRWIVFVACGLCVESYWFTKRNLKYSIFSSILSNIFQAKANLHKQRFSSSKRNVRREFGYEPQKGFGLQIESLRRSNGILASFAWLFTGQRQLLEVVCRVIYVFDSL